MAISSEEIKLFTRRIVLVGAGVLVLGEVVNFFLLRSQTNEIDSQTNEIKSLIRTTRGDTPVVLVGDSVILGEHSSSAGDNWQSVTPTTKYDAPAGTVVMIVVKNNPGDGDGDTGTDRLRIPIPTAPGTTWEIDLYTNEVNGIAVTIKPNSTNIEATAVSGALCFDSGNKNLNYSHTVCSGGGTSSPGPDTFNNVVVKINNISIGTLNCVNYAGAPNLCKIVLKT
jgi:hypothetical protein